MSDISDSIKAALPLSQWFDLLRPGTTGGKSGLFKVCCPFHNETHPSFQINDATGQWYCFGGGCSDKSGDVFTAYMRLNNIYDFNEAVERLAPMVGIQYERGSQFAPLYAICEAAADYYCSWIRKEKTGKLAREYLLNERHVTGDSIRKWRLGYAPESETNLLDYLLDKGFTADDILSSGLCRRVDNKADNTYWLKDRLSNRIVFPIFSRTGKVIAFGGRRMPDEPDREPKFLNTAKSPLYDKSRTLYGLNFAHDAIFKEDNVAVVEGYLDAIIAHQEGIEYVVAACGTAVTEFQIAAAIKYTNRVTLVLDPDKAGAETTINLIPKLQVIGNKIVDLRVGYMPTDTDNVDGSTDVRGLDPDETILDNAEGFKMLVGDLAEPAFDAVIRYYSGDVTPDMPLGQRQAIADKLALMANTPHETQTQANLRRIKTLLTVSIAKPRYVTQGGQNKETSPPSSESVILAFLAACASGTADYDAVVVIQRTLSRGCGNVSAADFEDFDDRALWNYLNDAVELTDVDIKLSPEQVTKLEMLALITPTPLVFQRTLVHLRRKTLERMQSMTNGNPDAIEEIEKISKRIRNARKLQAWLMAQEAPLLEFIND